MSDRKTVPMTRKLMGEITRENFSAPVDAAPSPQEGEREKAVKALFDANAKAKFSGKSLGLGDIVNVVADALLATPVAAPAPSEGDEHPALGALREYFIATDYEEASEGVKLAGGRLLYYVRALLATSEARPEEPNAECSYITRHESDGIMRCENGVFANGLCAEHYARENFEPRPEEPEEGRFVDALREGPQIVEFLRQCVGNHTADQVAHLLRAAEAWEAVRVNGWQVRSTITIPARFWVADADDVELAPSPDCYDSPLAAVLAALGAGDTKEGA